MPDDPFVCWAKRYSTLFGLTTPQDGAMVFSWIAILRDAGFSASELEAATDWLAANEPPQWRTEHLSALQKRLRGARDSVRRQRVEEPMPGDRGNCATCSGGGMVVVPHPRVAHGGLWATCAVLCACPMGRWVGDHQTGRLPNGEARSPLLSLAQYELLVPDWRRRMAAHDDLSRRAVNAESEARHLDRLMGELRRKWPSRRGA